MKPSSQTVGSEKDLPSSSQKNTKERDSKIKVFIRKRPLLKGESGKTDLLSVPFQVFL